MIFHCLLLSLTLCQALRDRPVVILSAVQTSAIAYDYTQTRLNMLTPDGVEHDALMRPFVHNSGTLAVEGAAEILLAGYVAEKMKHSRHSVIRKVWWLPQTLNVAWHLSGAISSTLDRNQGLSDK
jgi:hypothetical protein